MRKAVQRIAAFLIVLASVPCLAFAQGADRPGSSDHPAVGRYEGAFISFYEQKEYAELRMPFRGLERADRDNPSAWQSNLSGRLTSIGYEGPAGRSALEIVRNHEAALKASGFDVRFFCHEEEQCSPGRMIPTFWEAAKGAVRLPNQFGGSTYMLAEKDGPDGRVTVAMYAIEIKASGSRPMMPHLAVTVVEGKPMDTDRITIVEASAMETALARDGRIAIYGILFDFDKAVIRPDSRDQIAEIGKLLTANPALDVLIVGHTDGQGAFAYNLTLSQGRAQAVANALAAEHGIAESRLTPAGAGMVAPVASNRTEEGRAQNRRVEIVERYKGG